MKSQEEQQLLKQGIACLLKMGLTVLTLHAIWWSSSSSHSRDIQNVYSDPGSSFLFVTVI